MFTAYRTPQVPFTFLVLAATKVRFGNWNNSSFERFLRYYFRYDLLGGSFLTL